MDMLNNIEYAIFSVFTPKKDKKISVNFTFEN